MSLRLPWFLHSLLTSMLGQADEDLGQHRSDRTRPGFFLGGVLLLRRPATLLTEKKSTGRRRGKEERRKEDGQEEIVTTKQTSVYSEQPQSLMGGTYGNSFFTRKRKRGGSYSFIVQHPTTIIQAEISEETQQQRLPYQMSRWRILVDYRTSAEVLYIHCPKGRRRRRGRAE